MRDIVRISALYKKGDEAKNYHRHWKFIPKMTKNFLNYSE